MHTAPLLSPARRLLTTAAVAGALLASVVVATPAAAAPAPAPDRTTRTVPLCATEVAPGHARCFAIAEVGADGAAKGTTPRGLTPADLLAAYGLPADGGAGTTVAIVDAYDAPTAAADLAVYRSTMGLPALRPGQLRTVDQRGGTDLPAPDPGWAGEIALDLDAVSAIAPQADLLLVETDSSLVDDLGQGVAQAVALGADVVSNSYGSRYANGPGAGENPDQLAQDAAYYDHPGVAVVASTGDDGYGVAYPAASPHVTAVGGTRLTRASGTVRGWREQVWNGAGSGCSVQQPRPAWQTGTGCDHRATADVAAVADPATGLASYNTYSGHGWQQVGGTSLAAPVVAGVYALAGRAVAGTEPVTYPWAHRDALNDVTQGSNGSCDTTAWCTAGPGWDGPTGLGTPHGTAAFATGPHGTLAGTVTTTAASHAPVADATVTATRVDGTADATDRTSAVTDADGRYSLTVSAGRWTVSASAYGSHDATGAAVTVRAEATTVSNLALAPRPVRTVSGRVTDGAGHGWALPATVRVDGVPGAPVVADAATGRFHLALPAGRTYSLEITGGLPGYQPATRQVTVGGSDVHLDVALTTDPYGAAPPGYAAGFDAGATQSFPARSTPRGWTVTDTGDTPGWTFDDAGSRGNQTGGTGGFAIADSDHQGSGHHQDSWLTGPVSDLRTAAHPALHFRTYLNPYDGQTTTVELSVDGGTTWTQVWAPSTTSNTVLGPVSVPLPAAAHQQSVRVRFHYAGTWATWWELDDVALGDVRQDVLPGGLVVGRTTDATTGAGVTGVGVTGPGAVGATTVGGGVLGWARFEVFAPAGAATWTARRPGYRPAPVRVVTVADRVTTAAFDLTSGRTVAPPTTTVTVDAGGTASANVTITNTGTAPVTVRPHEQASGYGVPGPTAAAPTVEVPAAISRRPAVVAPRTAATAATTTRAVGRGGWRDLAAPPVALQDNAVATGGGAVWSVGGVDASGLSAALYRLDLTTGTWSRRADASTARQLASAAFVGGKLYVTGGFGAGGFTTDRTEAYDPRTNTWTTVAPVPSGMAAMGTGVVGGKLYVVGGCTLDWCGTYDLQVYDPATNTWTQGRGLDESTSFAACGGIGPALYCAGGTRDDDTRVTATWRYDPGPNRWTRLADTPTDQWGGAVGVGDGRLVVSGGVVDNRALTNRSWAFDPGLNRWTALPNAPVASYRGGGASGLFVVGGSTGTATPLRTTYVLPGWGVGGAADASWLAVDPTPLLIAPGASVTVAVHLTAGAVTPAGSTYRAAVVLDDDSPYRPSVVQVSMRVR